MNRFRNPPFISDKIISKNDRGSSDEVVSCDGDVVSVKWYDNKAVYLASNFVGIGEIDEVERWDKKEKCFVKVKRPEIVRHYNESMGGVDKHDQYISYYRIFI